MNMIKDRSTSYILTIVVGILMLISPYRISKLAFMVVGAIVAINGVAGLLVGGKVSRYDRDGLGIVGNSVLNIIIGLLLIFKNSALMSICSYMFGIYLIFDGVTGVTTENGDGISKILHILMAVVGVVLLLHPLRPWFDIVRGCGIALIADGVIGMATGSSLIHRG